MRSFDEILKEYEDFFAMEENADSKLAGLKGRDITKTVELEFGQTVTGCERKLTFARKEICTSCRGSKFKRGSVESVCEHCEGKGYTEQELGRTIAQSKCVHCNGLGKTRPACPTCSGIGTVR